MENSNSQNDKSARNLKLRGRDVIRAGNSQHTAHIMDFPTGGYRRMAGSIGAENDCEHTGSGDRRTKGFRPIKRAIQLMDVAWLGFCVAGAIVIVLVEVSKLIAG